MQILSSQMLSGLSQGHSFASKLPPKISYSIKDDAVPVAGSIPTAYRRLNDLEIYGLVNVFRGKFQINRAARQPMHILEQLAPSLLSLKNARKFGRKYNTADITFFKNNLPENSFVTLDYRSWDLTKYQTPQDLCVYVNNVQSMAEFLKSNNFSEGTRGHVVLLEKQPSTEDTIQQVYLDCIAKGGRSILDAIAIEIKYNDNLQTRGRFNIDDILKVQNDLQSVP